MTVPASSPQSVRLANDSTVVRMEDGVEQLAPLHLPAPSGERQTIPGHAAWSLGAPVLTRKLTVASILQTLEKTEVKASKWTLRCDQKSEEDAFQTKWRSQREYALKTVIWVTPWTLLARRLIRVGFNRDSDFVTVYLWMSVAFWLCNIIITRFWKDLSSVHIQVILVVYGVVNTCLLQFEPSEENDRLSPSFTVTSLLLVSTMAMFLTFPFATALMVMHSIVWVSVVAPENWGEDGFVFLHTLGAYVVVTIAFAYQMYSQEFSVRQNGLVEGRLLEETILSEQLVRNAVPLSCAKRLKQGEEVIADEIPSVAILFVDIDGFSEQLASDYRSPQEVMALLNDLFTDFDNLCDKHGVTKIESISSVFMTGAGVGDPPRNRKVPLDMTNPETQVLQTINLALDMMDTVSSSGLPVALRIGIHVGPVVAGVIGTQLPRFRLFGDTVNVASRMCSSAERGKIQCSLETWTIAKSLDKGLLFDPRGSIPIKGKGLMDTFYVDSLDHRGSYAHSKRRSSGERSPSLSFVSGSSLAVSVSPRARAQSTSIASSSPRDKLKMLNSMTLVNSDSAAKEKLAGLQVQPLLSSEVEAIKHDVMHEVKIASRSVRARRFKTSYNDPKQESAYRRMLLLGNRTSVSLLALGLCLTTYVWILCLTRDTKNGQHYTWLAALVFQDFSLLLLWKLRHFGAGRFHFLAHRGLVMLSVSSIAISTIVPYIDLGQEFRGYVTLTLVMLHQWVGWMPTIGRNLSVLFNLTTAIMYVVANRGVVDDMYQRFLEAGILIISFVINGIRAHTRDRISREQFMVSNLLANEGARNDQLLMRLLPAEVATKLKGGEAVAESKEWVSILFADLVGFTPMASQYSPTALCNILNQVFSEFDAIIDEWRCYKVETIGDCIVVAAGLLGEEEPNSSAFRLVEVGEKFIDRLEAIRSRTGHPLSLRVGIHSGPVVAGVVGRKIPRYHIFGASFETANMMETTSKPNRIHVSASTKRLLDPVTHMIRFDQADVVEVCGQSIETYFVRIRSTIEGSPLGRRRRSMVSIKPPLPALRRQKSMHNPRARDIEQGNPPLRRQSSASLSSSSGAERKASPKRRHSHAPSAPQIEPESPPTLRPMHQP